MLGVASPTSGGSVVYVEHIERAKIQELPGVWPFVVAGLKALPAVGSRNGPNPNPDNDLPPSSHN